MLLNDIYYEAGELEHANADRPSWAKPYQAKAPTSKRRGPRALIGRALINLGRVIAAEPSPAAAQVVAQVRVGR